MACGRRALDFKPVQSCWEQRAEVHGLRMVYEPKYLRFFQARFEPLG